MNIGVGTLLWFFVAFFVFVVKLPIKINEVHKGHKGRHEGHEEGRMGLIAHLILVNKILHLTWNDQNPPYLNSFNP